MQNRNPLSRPALSLTLLLTANVTADLSNRPSLANAPGDIPFALTTENVLLIAGDANESAQDVMPKELANGDDGEHHGDEIAMRDSDNHELIHGRHDEHDRDHVERNERGHDHDSKYSTQANSSRRRFEHEHESSHER